MSEQKFAATCRLQPCTIRQFNPHMQVVKVFFKINHGLELPQAAHMQVFFKINHGLELPQAAHMQVFFKINHGLELPQVVQHSHASFEDKKWALLTPLAKEFHKHCV
jgi:hypothetical protein